MTTDVSVIIPAYKCASTLKEVCAATESALKSLQVSYEIILINDGSPEDDWHIIRSLAELNPRIKGIALHTNYGQHNAIACGISYAQGTYLVVMDGDMQDNPAYIPELYKSVLQGKDIVYALRNRKDLPFFKRLSSFFFKKVMRYILGVHINPDIANYCILRRSLIDEIKEFTISCVKFLPSLSAFYGVRYAFVDVHHTRRSKGTSGYDFPRRFKLGIEIVNAFAGMRLEFFFKAMLIFMLLIIAGNILLLFLKPLSLWAVLLIVLIMGGAATLMFLSSIVVNNIKNLKRNKGQAIYAVAETINIEVKD